jgi:hypothetical protein
MARRRSNLSSPTESTWWIATVIGALGILGALTPLPVVSENAFWFVAAAFVIFALATRMKGL